MKIMKKKKITKSGPAMAVDWSNLTNSVEYKTLSNSYPPVIQSVFLSNKTLALFHL